MKAQKVAEMDGRSVYGRIVRVIDDSVFVEVIVIPNDEVYSSHVVEVDRWMSQCVRDAVINAIYKNPAIMGW